MRRDGPRPGLAAITARAARIRDLALASSVLRPVLWLLLIGLTTALLAYPRDMALEYSPIQSLDVVEPVPVFAGLYYAWMATLVSLVLLLTQGGASRWQGLGLVAMFALVYRGFWDIPFAAVKHVDSLSNATTSEYIRSAGEVPFGHANIAYADYPGLHTLTAVFANVTGLATADAVTVLAVSLALLMAGIVYLVGLRVLEDARWAAIAALLAMQGAIMFSRWPFYPGMLGFVFASTFLLLALMQGKAMFGRLSYVLLALVLLAANTITHMVTPMLVVFLVVGMWLVTYARRGSKEPFPTSALLLYAVVPITWLIYVTVKTFGGTAEMVTEFVNNIQRDFYLKSALIIGGSNFGVAVPLWATMVKLYWIFLTFGAGTVAALLRLRRRRSLPPVEARAVGALLGILMLSVTIGLVSTGGLQLFRYVMYAPLVLAPLLLLSIRNLPGRLGPVGLGALAVSLVALSVPTFFAHYPTVRQEMFYAYETVPAQTLSSHEGEGSNLRVFAPAAGFVAYVNSLPEAEYMGTPVEFTLADYDGLWAHIDDQVDLFVAGVVGERVSIYVQSNRSQVYYKHNFGVPLDDPRWEALRIRLEGEAAVYDNGFVTLYEATEPRAAEEAIVSGR